MVKESPDHSRHSYYSKLFHMRSHGPMGSDNLEEIKREVSRASSTQITPVAPPIMTISSLPTDKGSRLNEGERVLEKFEDKNCDGFALNYIGSEWRVKYLHTLAKTGVWVPVADKPKTHQTGNLILYLVIIFDWDDTLLCTSYLTQGETATGIPVITETTKNYLNELEPVVVLLNMINSTKF